MRNLKSRREISSASTGMAIAGLAVLAGFFFFTYQYPLLQAQPGPAAAAAAPADEVAAVGAAIRKVLQTQETAWNAGDIDGFMEYYWKSDALTFSSGGKTTRGWRETLARYKERYPTKAAMGRTTFSKLEITPLGDAAALVLGEWRLRRQVDGADAGETIGGNFSLVFRRIDGKWVIIHDHTSQAATLAD